MTNKLFFDVKPDDWVFEKIIDERKSIGYYNLPKQNLTELENYKKEFEIKNPETESLVIIGIGGSSLGAKAIYQTISNSRKLERNIFFLESTDPISIENTIKKLDLKKSHFFVISKSGTTIETISIYKYILYILNENKIEQDYRFTYITEKGTPLELHSKTKKCFCLHINKNIGGRFSVLSNAGLAPLYLSGIDVKNLLYGAKNIQDGFFNNKLIKSILLKKATFYAKNSMRYNINALFIYSESLKSFGEWYVQLWGESLGKRQLNSSFNVGLTPISLIGPKDQHSFLQLIVEGHRDKSVTFIKIDNFNKDINIPDNQIENLYNMNFLNNLSFNSLINLQADSVIDSLVLKGDIPIDIITLKKIDENNLGQIIYYYELLTSLVAKLIGVNAYDQPGVEESKKILSEKLKKVRK